VLLAAAELTFNAKTVHSNYCIDKLYGEQILYNNKSTTCIKQKAAELLNKLSLKRTVSGRISADSKSPEHNY